eukprot:3506354-Pleurochrysis_carterae.AAC.2
MHPVATLTGRKSTDGVPKGVQPTGKIPKAVQPPALDNVVCLKQNLLSDRSHVRMLTAYVKRA